MKLLNERSQIRNIASTWRGIYDLPPYINATDKQEIGNKLGALDCDKSTAADVAEIIGNPEWIAKVKCDECGIETFDAVECGESIQHEQNSIVLCGDCLRAALRLLNE